MRIRQLEAQILADERQAILCWTLDGACRCIAQDGYTVPFSSTQAVHEWRQRSDSAFLFATEACKDTEGSKGCSTLDALYSAYKDFCEKEDIEKMVKKPTLGQRLAKYRHKTHKGNHYHLALVEPSQPSRGAIDPKSEQYQAAEREADDIANFAGSALDTGRPVPLLASFASSSPPIVVSTTTSDNYDLPSYESELQDADPEAPEPDDEPRDQCDDFDPDQISDHQLREWMSRGD